MKLKRNFFAKDAKTLARDLLGKYLVRRFPDGATIAGMITETEAYLGPQDLASHAALGRRTKRNEVMYGRPGLAYVYFTYGMHWLLNVVCSKVADPQAVLIRGLYFASGPPLARLALSGPARLTKLLKIDGRFNGEDLVTNRNLWLEDRGVGVSAEEIEITPRIGIGYAGKWKNKPLRFVLQMTQRSEKRANAR